MGWLTDTLDALRQIVLLEHRVSTLEAEVKDARRELESHDRRIQQIETVLFGPISPDRLRLPRG